MDRKNKRAGVKLEGLQKKSKVRGEDSKQQDDLLSPNMKNLLLDLSHFCIVIGVFIIIAAGGPLVISLAVLAVQIYCFNEMIEIGYNIYQVRGLLWFRSLLWYFFIVANYYFCGELFMNYFVYNQQPFIILLAIKYHRVAAFILYFLGLIFFLMSMKKYFSQKLFHLLFWAHIAIMIIGVQSYLYVNNIFEGIIWFIVPVAVVSFNELLERLLRLVFCGKSSAPVTQRELYAGFIGCGIMTVIFGVIVSSYLCQLDFLICSLEECKELEMFSNKYKPHLFAKHEYHIFNYNVMIYPIVFHSVIFSTVGSIIGPFSGVFVSVFKRAFAIKNLDVDGVWDHLYTQYLMATFVNIYISTFIKGVTQPAD